MKRHRSFEFFVGEYLLTQGYSNVDVTQGVADWGVDAYCQKDDKKYVVQAKMYGDCKTKVNRRQMMELYGVMHYFDCQGAIMIYNGGIMDDALLAAHKLGIQLLYLDQNQMDEPACTNNIEDSIHAFDSIWNEVRSLQGCTISNSRGTTYQILTVTDGDITYINQNGKKHKDSADLFRRILARVLRYGYVQQCQLRNEFETKASAFISTVFANLPSCVVTPNPATIRLR